MKQLKTYRIFTLLTIWTCFGGLAAMAFSVFTPGAAAQEPTALPTATIAATWTPNSVPVIPTPLPTFTPVPGTTPTPSGRFVEFRADDQEIESGDCALLSWVVRGDFFLVEFDEHDDDLEPVLVSEMDSREECPDNETEYELIVTWSDNNRQTVEIDIDVVTNSNGSSSSGGGSGGGGETVPTPGVFIVVTPILITDSFANMSEPASSPTSPTEAIPVISTASSVPTPAGILGTINKLPETGESAAKEPVILQQPAGLSFIRLIKTVGLLVSGLLLLFAVRRRAF